MQMSDRLRSHRRAAGITQRAVARAVGTSQGSVAGWESGAWVPGADRIAALAALYQLGATETAELHALAAEALQERRAGRAS